MANIGLGTLSAWRVDTRHAAMILAVIISAVFAGVLLGTIDFPYGTHFDEGGKIEEIVSGRYNSRHPILMLQLARFANSIAGFTGLQPLAELGRSCAVIAGGAMVFATFLLAREVVPMPTALAATLAVAVAPLTTVHSRYFKEDVFAAPFLVLALVALMGVRKSPTPARSVLLGAAIGLAAAAKYVAMLSLPFAIAVLLLDSIGATDKRARLVSAGLAALVAIAVFALVELPALRDFAQFQTGFLSELEHAESGDVAIPVTLSYGLFHLRASLLPGLGLPLLMLGLLGLAAPMVAPSERRQPLLVIAAFALLWYGVHEVSPLKPFPGFARYMLPLVPLLVVLGAAFIREFIGLRSDLASGVVAAAIVFAAAVQAFHLSVLTNRPAIQDPRSVIVETVLRIEPRAAIDRYTDFTYAAILGFGPSPIAGGAVLVVTSNFTYGRFTEYGSAPVQREDTRAAAAYYAGIFEHPYLEVSNGGPSFGFFNPVIRIVAVDYRGDRLVPIAEAIRRIAPTLKLRIIGTNESVSW